MPEVKGYRKRLAAGKGWDLKRLGSKLRRAWPERA